jgi:hypothetical protein
MCLIGKQNEDLYRDDPVFHHYADMVRCMLEKGEIDAMRLINATNVGITLFYIYHTDRKIFPSMNIPVEIKKGW